MHPKQKVHLDKKYLAWIRTKPCLACGATEGIQAHHCWCSGKKNHGNDRLVVPLCVSCHTFGKHAYHNIGHERFEEHWNLDLKDEIINYLSEYLETKNGF